MNVACKGKEKTTHPKLYLKKQHQGLDLTQNHCENRDESSALAGGTSYGEVGSLHCPQKTKS